MKPIYIILIIIILVVLGVSIYVLRAPKTTETPLPVIKNEFADWQAYNNPKTKITFRYPPDWEIREDDFYKESQNPTIVICQKEDPVYIYARCIQINMPQFPCETVTRIKGNYIGICDKDRIDVYKKVVSSFKIKE